MNILEIYNKVTYLYTDNEENKLTNFMDGLKYSDNLGDFKLIHDELVTNTAINSITILPSFKSNNLFNDVNDKESTLKVLNIEYSLSVGDFKDIAGIFEHNRIINKLCESIQYSTNIVSFILK